MVNSSFGFSENCIAPVIDVLVLSTSLGRHEGRKLTGSVGFAFVPTGGLVVGLLAAPFAANVFVKADCPMPPKGAVVGAANNKMD